MSLLLVLDFTEEFVMLLGHKALGSVEAVSRSTRAAIIAGGGWAGNLEHEIPGFSLQGECLLAASPGGDVASLRQLKAFVAKLRLASSASTFFSQVPEAYGEERQSLSSLADARLIATKVGRALNDSKAHVERGGASSKTLITRISFPDYEDTDAYSIGTLRTAWRAASSAAFAGAHFWASREAESVSMDGVEGWRISLPVPVMMPRATCGKSEKSSSSSSSSEDEKDDEDTDHEMLLLQLAWRLNDVMIRVMSLEGSAEIDQWGEWGYMLQANGRQRCLTVDICSVKQAPLLQSIGTHVTLDGTWQEINGISASLLCRSKLGPALEHGLLSIVTVRNCCLDDKALLETRHIADSLHLEICEASR
eukprot:TRINITY_DN35810_c0_g1_i1.p1 TRINITY_DN35810_c0_g1~~TRINITY_DN35810_c0_g1_i1.p1  ORF type:complete len:365 (-),score=70.30 TRINITY_DN35810_c0_g1_i1:386-1480(-)